MHNSILVNVPVREARDRLRFKITGLAGTSKSAVSPLFRALGMKGALSFETVFRDAGMKGRNSVKRYTGMAG